MAGIESKPDTRPDCERLAKRLEEVFTGYSPRPDGVAMTEAAGILQTEIDAMIARAVYMGDSDE